MDYAAVTQNVKAWVQAHPNIAKLDSMGKSYEGRDLWIVTITNPNTGAPEDKPALYVEGGMDSDEVITVQSAMYLLHWVLTAYGSDPAVTELVDTQTLYLAPNVIPDQSEVFFHTPKKPRDSSTRPYDNDFDGLVDEDDMEDIDGDGQILQMRVKDPQGNYKKDPDDPRVMVRRIPSDGPEGGPFYRLYSREGIDNDGDGQFNEDPVGGVDVNRNWPAFWAQEYMQSWAGPYPLSEVECQNVLKFLMNHPNIASIVDLHSSGNLLYRPSSVYPDKDMNRTDRAFYRAFGRRYTEITDGQVFSVFEVRQNPSHGIMIDWAYDHLGVFAFAPELWAFPVDKNGLENHNATESERINWAIKNFGANVWNDWKPFNHPQLGDVELGGWCKLMDNNPMGAHVERIASEITEWMIFMWSQLPHIEVGEVTVDRVDEQTFRIEMTVSNIGFMPTNVTEIALKNGLAHPIFLTVEADKGLRVVGLSGGTKGHRKGKKGIMLGHLGGGWGVRTSKPHSVTAGLIIVDERRNQASTAKIQLIIDGKRAGTIRRTIELTAKR